tara:strand:- start:266 stop:571 length:306 start_codon:yes stop_codon:yes gene_type:complete
MDQVIYAVQQFGFPIIIAVGLGYFVYYVWRTIINVINPAIKSMHMGLIKLIDQIRMLDNDMIRLQEKVDTVLQIKENEKINRSSNTISRDDSDSRPNRTKV